MIFYTSDLHLGHARICELAERPFMSVTEMDNEIIDRWNSVVTSDDTVYVLGDVALGSFAESIKKVAELAGHKILVPGNHDRVSSLYQGGSPAKRAEWRKAYEDVGFNIVAEEVDVWIADDCVTLCHFPFEGDSHKEDRYLDARPTDVGQFLLHGHVHERYQKRGRQIHVGVDAWDYTPVPETKIIELMRRSV